MLRVLKHEERIPVRLTAPAIAVSMLLILALMLAPAAWRGMAWAKAEAEKTTPDPLNSSEDHKPVSMSAKEFARLSAEEQKALLVRVFQRRLEHSRNLYYETDQIVRGFENRDGRPGKPLEQYPAGRHQFRHWRLGDSYRMDVNGYQNPEEAQPSMRSSMAVNAAEGLARHAIFKDGERPPNGYVGHPCDPGDSNLYLNWLTHKFSQRHPTLGDYLLPYLLDHKDDFKIEAPVAGDKVRLTVPWRPQWNGKRVYTLDPGKGFLPVRCDSSFGNPANGRGMWRKERLTVKDSRLVGDVWMPVSLKNEVTASTIPELMNVYDVKVARIEHGTATAADIRVPFTEGMKIRDTVEGATYTADAQGKPGPDLKLAPNWRHKPPKGWQRGKADGMFSMASRFSPADIRKLAAARGTIEDKLARMEKNLNVLRSDSTVPLDDRIEAGLKILREYKVGENQPIWAGAIRELTEIGKPAVPKLIEELDRTERANTLRALAFILRGIDDPRAAPALIRAISRTFQAGGGDYGLRIYDDPDLAKFMGSHNTGKGSGTGGFNYGAPRREIMPTLEKLTRHAIPHNDLRFAYFEGGAKQRRLQQEIFLKFTRGWADWWSEHWRDVVENEEEAQLDLIEKSLGRYAEGIARTAEQPATAEFPRGPHVTVSDWTLYTLIRSFKERPEEAFFDLDSGRHPRPSKAIIEASAEGKPSKELLDWAEKEGVDLITVKVKNPDGEGFYHAFWPVGMKVWRIDSDRYDKIGKELRRDKPFELPKPWQGPLTLIDEKTGKYEKKSTASYLFITKEGICGRLRLKGPLYQEYGVGAGGDGGMRFDFVYEGEGELKRPEAEEKTPDPLNPSEEAAPAKTVHGKVVDENGVPIPGADVWMMPVYNPARETPATHATTDEKGRFVVAVPEASERDLKRVGSPHGPQYVLAYADGHQLEVEAAWGQISGRDESDVVIRLKRAVETEFIVWGPDGKPKAGAIVQPRHINTLGCDPPKEVRARIAAKTDAEGRAVLTAVPREAIASVDVITDDLGIQNQTTHTSGGGGDRAFEVDLPAGQPIQLRPSARIVGRITAENPEWARGVRVVLHANPIYRSDRPLPPWPTTGHAEVVSDEQGRFEVPGIAEGALCIIAKVDDRLPVLPVDPDTLIIDLASKPKKTIEVEIPLVRKIPTRGRVRVAKSGEPIPGVILQINYGTGLRQSTHVMTDDEGTYTASVVPGKNQLAILGYPDGYRHLDCVRGVEYEVPEDAEEFQIPVLDVGEKEPAEEPTPSKKPAPAEKPSSDRGDQPASRGAEPPKASSAKPEAPDILIHGCVGDESGTPISGAKLWLPVKYEDDKRLAKAVTDEAGLFTLRVPKEWTEPGRFYPGFTIWCHAPGHGIATASASKQLQGKSDAPIEIALAPSTDTGFEVKNLEGDLIRGARVEPIHFLTRMGYEIVPTVLREVVGAETNGRGVALLPAIGRDRLDSIRVTAEGYGVQELQLCKAAEEPAVRPIRLSSTGRLEGRLLCDDPSVFEGLRVHVQPDQPPRSNEYAVAGGFADVDEKGRFVFPACAEGSIRLLIPIVEPGAWAPRIPENLRIATGETTEVEVPFERTVRVRGRVRIKETDAPVAEAMVLVSYGSFHQGNLVRTDAAGHFETNVLPGKVQQQLISKSVKYSDWIIEIHSELPIRVPADVETVDLPPLELTPPVKRSGRLVDGENRPVAEADILAIVKDHYSYRAKTDASGAFTLHLPKDREVEKYQVARSRGGSWFPAAVLSESPLVLQCEGEKKTPIPPAPPAAEKTTPAPLSPPEVEEKTPDPLNSSDILIHGHVADESGTPVAGAKLWLPVKLEDDDRLAKATTDEAGRFTLRVPADWIESEAFPIANRIIWCYATKHRIAVAPASNQLTGESDDPIEIVLKPSTDTRFEVRNLQGDPIRGARVEPGLFLERAAREMVPTELREVVGAETNDRGVALLPAMRRDFPPIRVTAPGYGVQELQWSNSAEEPAVRTLRLSPTGRLEGRLLCDDPSEFEGLRVCIDTDQPRRSDEVAVAAGFAEVDEKGRFVFPECAEGPVRLLIPIVEPGAWAPRIPENVEIKAGETTEVDVPFGRTVRVRGQVRIKETEVPVAPAGVSVWYGSEWFQRNQVRTGSDGRFETNVLPGEVQQHLIMKPEEYSNWVMEAPDRRTPIRVPAGVETFDLPPVNLIPTVEHPGRLVDRENRPVTEARIHAFGKDRCSYSAETDESGAFILHLPKGFEIEKYEVARSREDSPVPTAVLSESPLVLQSVEEKTPVPPAPPQAEKTTPVPLNPPEETLVPPPALHAAKASERFTDRVVDTNGVGIPNATVMPKTQEGLIPRWKAVTDGEGRYTPAPFGPGMRQELITISAAGFVSREILRIGNDPSEINLSRAKTVEGTILGKDGKPLAGASLELHVYGDFVGLYGQHQRAVSDDNGKFIMENVPSGVAVVCYSGYRIEAAPGTTVRAYRPEPPKWLVSGGYDAKLVEMTDENPAPKVVLDLSKSTCGVEGTVIGPDQKPISGATVSARRYCRNLSFENLTVQLDGGGVCIHSDAVGRYKLQGLPPGKWALSVWHPEYQRPSKIEYIDFTEQGESIEQDLRVFERYEAQNVLPARLALEKAETFAGLLKLSCTGFETPSMARLPGTPRRYSFAELTVNSVPAARVNAEKLNLPTDATPEQIAKAARAGEFYYAAPDSLVPVNGTILVRCTLPEKKADDETVISRMSRLTRRELQKQVLKSLRTEPSALGRPVKLKKGDWFTAVRNDGKAFLIHILEIQPPGEDYLRVGTYYIGRLDFDERPAVSDFPARKAANAALAKTVHGKVVDENGTPIPGADVWMMPVYNPVRENPAAHVTTDSEGWFTVTVPALSERDLKRVGWPYRPDLVLAYADGRQLGTGLAGEQMAGHDKSDLIIRLKPGAETEFVVLGPDGKPKAGAVIEPRYPRNPHLELPREICARVAARTDAEGRAVLTAFPRDAIDCIDVVTDDLGIQRQHLIPRSGGGLKGSGGGMAFPVGLYSGEPIRLRQGGTIVGRITADKPEWTRGVRIMVTTSSRYAPAMPATGSPVAPDRFKDTGISTVQGFADVVSDEHGRFEIPVIAAGAMIINAVVDDRLPVLPITPHSPAVDPRSRPGETTEMEIPLVRTIPAVGSVRIEKTGQPIPGAAVRIARGTDLMQDMFTMTDAEGNYTATVLPGKNSVRINVPPQSKYRHLRPRVSLECEVPEDAKEFRIPVLEVGEKKADGDSPNDGSNPPRPYRTDSTQASSAAPEIPEILIHGCVADESGAPIAGAKLWLPLKYEDDKRLAKAVTDESGLFTLRVPKAWTKPGPFCPEGTVWCYAPKHRIAVAPAWEQLRGKSDAPIEIVLEPGTDTSFDVKNVQGDVIRGARVEPIHFFGHVIPSQLRDIIAAKTDDRGRALLPAMGRNGFLSVRVTAEGYGVQRLRLCDSSTQPAVRTVRLCPTGRLEGRLRCDDPSVFKGLRVHVWQKEPSHGGLRDEYAVADGFAEVDENGRFVLPACAEGPVRLLIPIAEPGAWAPRIPENVEIKAGETTEVEVPFERTVRVFGHVRLKESGAPAFDVMVSVSYGSFRQGNQVRTDIGGRFETNVLPGEIRQQIIIKPLRYSDWTMENGGLGDPILIPADAETVDLPPLELSSVQPREAIDKGMKLDELERSKRAPYRY